MTTVPITSLTPTTAPPSDKSIRGIVTLSWPYSSSTRQCALLLADPDFRLRSRKGQVRVRFAGASAEAVAKAHVGIGDDIVLSLNGASWEDDPEATKTPGKSVDGELFFRRKLDLKIVRYDGEVPIGVDAPITPPRSPENATELATPLPKAISDLRSSLDGSMDALPNYTYTSPAFVKRLRLSGESFLDSAFDPFLGGEEDVAQQESGHRTSFGTGLRWRYADKTSSPTRGPPETPAEIPLASEKTNEDVTEVHKMLPPPLPRLQVTSSAPPERAQAPDQQEGPSTPKLRPVQSPTLPLPSPFPTGTTPPMFGRSLPSITRVAERQEPSVDAESETDEDVQILDHGATERPPQIRKSSLDDGIEAEVDVGMSEEVSGEISLDSTNDDFVRHDDDAEMLDDAPEDIQDDEIEDVLKPNAIGMLIEDESENELLKETDGVVEVGNEMNESSEIEPEEREVSKTHVAELPRTPTKAPSSVQVGNFGLDGTTSAAPSVQATPTSAEKDKIMAQTYKSLFGFKTPLEASSPLSSPPALLEQPSSPPKEQLSELARARLGAAGIDLERDEYDTEAAMPGPPSEVRDVTDAEEAEETSPLSPAVPPSSVLPSQAEIIDLGSSSEEDEENEEDDEDKTPIAIESEAYYPEFASPEIQDSLKDSEAEDLLHPKRRVQSWRPKRHESLGSELRSKAESPDHLHGAVQSIPEARDIDTSVVHLAEESQQVIDDDPMPDFVEPNAAAESSTSPHSAIPETEFTPMDEHTPHPDQHYGGKALPETSKATMLDEAQSQGQSLGAGTALSQTTPVTAVIDLVSSSPREQAISSPPPESHADDIDKLEEPTKYHKLENDIFEVGNDDEVLAEVKTTAADVNSTSEPSPVSSEAQSVQMQPQTFQAPSYPSLPLSPLNSQLLEGMQSPAMLESVLTETMHSALPPTPQLTQAESFTQRQEVIDKQLSASQPMEVEDNDQILEQANEETAASKVEQRKSSLESQELVKGATPKSVKKTTTRRSLGGRLSNVPDVISAWFSPRRSNVALMEPADKPAEDAGLGQVDPSPMPQVNGHDLSHDDLLRPTHIRATGFSTSLSYFTPLSKLDELLNPSSQQSFGSKTVDIIAVVTDRTKEAVRAKAGPRDYFTTMHISDASLPPQVDVQVEVFRPWIATLPAAETGDVILLRGFAVRSRKRQAYLLSTDASAWCVWRFQDAMTSPENSKKPVWARKANAGGDYAVREEMKGPPVELGEEERQHAMQLRSWWQLLHGEAGKHEFNATSDEATMNGHVTRPITAKL